jgi:hypothetical protein
MHVDHSLLFDSLSNKGRREKASQDTFIPWTEIKNRRFRGKLDDE